MKNKFKVTVFQRDQFTGKWTKMGKPRYFRIRQEADEYMEKQNSFSVPTIVELKTIKLNEEYKNYSIIFI